MTPLAIAGYIVGVGGGVLAIFSRQPKQTIANYKELVESQEKRIKALEDQHKADVAMHFENAKAIADLQGQVKTYKDLALQSISSSMANIATTNKQILDVITAAERAKKTAVKAVKKDLEDKE